jgi:hypothetical protein
MREAPLYENRYRSLCFELGVSFLAQTESVTVGIWALREPKGARV